MVEFRRPKFIKQFDTVLQGEIIIYELKQNIIGVDAFLQALGYLKGIRSYFEKVKNINCSKYNFKIILIGSEINMNSSFCYLPEFLCQDYSEIPIDYAQSAFNLEIYTYKYAFDGIYFDYKNEFSLIQEGF